MENFIVTFARGFGTGGKEIASMLAKDLGIHCYENRILTLASQMSGLDEKLFLDINERIRNNGGFTGFLKGLPRSRQYIARNEKFVSDDRLFEYQSQIIRNLADQESCVIVGKCADYVLKGRKNVVSIYIEAPRVFCLPYHAAMKYLRMWQQPPLRIQISTGRTIINIIQKEITGLIPSITI